MTEPLIGAIPEAQETSQDIVYAPEFTDDEISQLFSLTTQITTPESDPNFSSMSWNTLDKRQRQLLIKRYGQPRHISRNIRVSDFTRGEGCADNERALPKSFDDNNFGVWDKHVLVYSLYGSAPTINPGTKVRVVPSGLVINGEGKILLPDFFYTPKDSDRRDYIVTQINKNPRSDKSVRLAEMEQFGFLKGTGLELTVYRRVSSQLDIGDNLLDSFFGRQALNEKGLTTLDKSDPMKLARQYIEVSQKIEAYVADLVSQSNLLLMRRDFADKTKVHSVTVDTSSPALFMMNVDTGQEIIVNPREFEARQETLEAVKDPTWHYGEDSRPWVFKYTSIQENGTLEKYVYINERVHVTEASNANIQST